MVVTLQISISFVLTFIFIYTHTYFIYRNRQRQKCRISLTERERKEKFTFRRFILQRKRSIARWRGKKIVKLLINLVYLHRILSRIQVKESLALLSRYYKIRRGEKYSFPPLTYIISLPVAAFNAINRVKLHVAGKPYTMK